MIIRYDTANMVITVHTMTTNMINMYVGANVCHSC
jgi:hypothetical protein